MKESKTHFSDDRVSWDRKYGGAWASEFSSRTLDIFFVLLIGPLLILALVIAVIATKLENPRLPVFFLQTRYGKGRIPFKMVKIRTMVVDAEILKRELLAEGADAGPGFKVANDRRVTKVGRFLRKTYVDEIPQLWNVLKGDMAIVGPRANSYPPTDYEPWQRIRLCVKPGITGSWQILRNKPYAFGERCLIDLEYVRTKSVSHDIAILFRTVAIMLTRMDGQ